MALPVPEVLYDFAGDHARFALRAWLAAEAANDAFKFGVEGERLPQPPPPKPLPPVIPTPVEIPREQPLKPVFGFGVEDVAVGLGGIAAVRGAAAATEAAAALFKYVLVGGSVLEASTFFAIFQLDSFLFHTSHEIQNQILTLKAPDPFEVQEGTFLERNFGDALSSEEILFFGVQRIGNTLQENIDARNELELGPQTVGARQREEVLSRIITGQILRQEQDEIILGRVNMLLGWIGLNNGVSAPWLGAGSNTGVPRVPSGSADP